MDIYIQLTIFRVNPEQQEMLIAFLADIGFDGFEQGANFLNAFIPEPIYENLGSDQLESISQYDCKVEKIHQKNWNEEWERSFEPVLVDDFCAIRASFHAAVQGTKYEIVITPKMSFGTGHHATTFLVIQMMQAVDFVSKHVLDFGTGTAVLAILAEKMGATQVHAIDIDEWSIENAKENLATNRSSRILIEQADHIASDAGYDIILANINRHVILAHLESIAKHLTTNGVLILSGLLKDDEEIVAEALSKHDLFVKAQSQKYDWIALRVTNVNPG